MFAPKIISKVDNSVILSVFFCSEIMSSSSSASTTCASVDCKETGKLKCSGCSTVSYCSQACQKKHWSTHKTVCKSLKAGSAGDNTTAAAPVTPPSPVAAASAPAPAAPVTAAAPTTVATSNTPPAAPVVRSELDIKFQAIQMETQKLFVGGNFEASIKSGLAALELAKEFPPAIANTEIVQIHLNCSSAFMQLQKFPEAVEHAEIAAVEAEKGLQLRPGQPQAIEVLAITLGTKAFSLLNSGKPDEASVPAERSLQLAEAIYPKNDQRLHKSIRALGLVRAQQGKAEEAEKLFFRSYTILSLSLGPQATEAQMSVDELCNMMLKKGDFATAEKYARINYKALSEKALDERGELILGDSASRLAQVLRRMNRLPEAEELMQQALTIREEKLARTNPIAIGYTLSQLAAIQETMGKADAGVEAKLMRALDIFGRLKGQNSPEVQNTLNQLRNVRSKRNGGAQAAPTEEDGLQYSVSQESKNRITSGSGSPTPAGPRPGALSPSNVAPATAPRAGTTASAPGTTAGQQQQTFEFSDTEEIARLNFAPEDGMARMMQANTYFEQGRFSCAEVVLAQAYQIFLRQRGPEDQITQAAKQNLGVARSNGLNRLWMQVVAALVLEQEEKLSSSLSCKSTLFTLYRQTLQ